MPRRLLLIVICLLTVTLSFSQNKKKNILVVCPYSLSGTWAKNTIEPITELDKGKMNITFSVMRNSSFKSVTEMDEREQVIYRNLDGKRPDLIIIFGPGNFILAENFNRKWKNVPMILTGELNYVCDKEYVCDSISRADVTRTPLSQFARGKNITFIHTPVYYHETIDMMLKVIPKLRTITFFGGEEYVSREIEQNMILASRDVGREFKSYHPDDITFHDLASIVSAADRKKEAFIYCNWHSKDGLRDATQPSEGVRPSLEKLVPVFNTFYSRIDDESQTAGFVAYDHDEFIEKIKSAVSAVIEGKVIPSKMPFTEISRQRPVLNYELLNRMGFNPSEIKGDFKFVKTPPTIWEKYRVSLLLLIVLILTLLTMFFYNLYKHQRKQAQTLLQTQKEMEKAKEKAELSDQIKTAFVQNVSHEIRTPLNAVVGFSQLLSLPDDIISQKEREQYAEYIENNSELLMMLVNDIFVVSDIERGELPIKLGDVPCNNVCQKAISTVETRVPDGVRMYFTTDAGDDVIIHSDSNRIQQVIINFLTNACKHTENGEIHIHCSLTENPGKVTFSVTDTGEGVPAEMAEKIFDRFTKLDNFKQGVGLGLNICRNIAEKLNGEVKLDTSYPVNGTDVHGARFLFILPR